jgi:branched-subunit amino acid transport protein
MSSQAEFWILIILLAAGTFLLRSVPLWTFGRHKMPEWLERLLRHVPASALAALVVPGALYTHLDGAYAFAPERAIATVVALLVALRFRNIIAVIAAGMVTLWIATALM